ncbi:MAG: Y-family DNA polymerase [Flavobacteriales bacterium]|nr:Y-family DNA polymerase [Flavobacteriales bacterium]
MIALLDCNNFYVSCERVFRPELNNRPVIVLSNNDGCIISRSNEAKKLGIPMGTPVFKCEDIIKKNKVKVFSSNYTLYGDMSHRVMSILSKFSPDIEVYSIDEAFFGLDGFSKYYPINDYGTRIRKTVLKNTGIPTSVGIAPTKTLAKVAAEIAKKYPQLEGVYTLDTPEKTEKALKWLPISGVWGIGRGYSEKVKDWGVQTAFDFTKLSDSLLKQKMGIQGLKIKRELLGEPCVSLELRKEYRQAVATTRTFSTYIEEFDKLEQTISNFAINCAEKLRKEKTYCSYLTVYLKTDIHRQNHKQYNKKIAIKLPHYTNSNIDVIHYARMGLKTIFENGHKYKRAGVVLFGIVPEDNMQLNIFYETNKHKKLMSVIDHLNHKIGAHKVRIAAQGTDKVWQMKQENLSQKYTTHWKELMEVKG